MAKQWQKVAAIATSAVLACGLVVGMTACKKEEQPYDIEKRASTGWEDEREYTYNTYTGQLPAMWTDLGTSDAADNELIGYINSSFYEYDYEYDANGEIVPGGFEVEYSAATKLEDVTAKYAGQYGIPAGATEGQAFAITLRDDLRWDDGTPIHAEDFVYTMSQQLSPNYLFEQASNYYSGNYIIHNAQNYVYQGQSGWFPAHTPYSVFEESLYDHLVFTLGNSTENKEAYGGAVVSFRTGYGFPDSYTAADVAEYITTNGVNTVVDATVDEILALQGKTYSQIIADDVLKATWEKVLACWKTVDNEELDFFVVEYTYPEMDFSEVGYFVGENENELVIAIDNTLNPLDENGDLAYGAAYYLQSFPLVKRDLWEKLEDRSRTPWTNAYNTASVANSASWGPYKLTEFQAGVVYTLERNEEWYGYGLEQYALQYQTDRIVTRYIPEWNTAWQSFQLGDLDGVGLDVTVINDYRNSERAYYTPSTTTFSLQLNAQESTYEKGKNIMLKYKDFRQALSLSIDRDEYCAQCDPSSLAALGFLNDMYYYDVENGGVYRDTEQAKSAILNAYGAVENEDGSWTVGSVTYDDIDEAVESVTGYNLTLARELMTKAYEEAKAAGDYTDGDSIVLTYGIQEQTANQERVRAFFENAFSAALEGTPMEGKLKIEFYTISAATWDTQFRNGEYDISFSGFGNAAFDPFYLFGASQIWDANRFAQGWDPDSVTLTLDVKGGEGQESYEDLTMNLTDWDKCLQGLSGCRYNFSNYPIETKLEILAAEEAAVLQEYWGLPMFAEYSASLMSYKVDYISYEYNTFMGYGGVRYMSYNFDDTEWKAFVEEKGGTLNYTF